VVVTVATHAQRSDVATLARKAGITPTAARVSPGAPDILALTGPRAAYVTPSAAPVQDEQKRPQRGGGGGRGQSQSRGRSSSSSSSRSSGTSSSSSSSRSGGSRSSSTSTRSSGSISAFSSGAGRRSR
jgi:hypothetical protein